MVSCSSDKNLNEGSVSGNHASGHGGSSSSATNKRKLQALENSISIREQILPSSSRSRTRSSMTPQYITIHSTQNWSKGADAMRHSLALSRGALGKFGWHYTTDENVAVQHIPDTEQGNHAENYRGPGNRYSIGIEMCEHPGNSRSATIDKTARLAAYLMHEHSIPLSRIVPHYNWPRKGYAVANKNCPHFLLDNGKPGKKWNKFLGRVNHYYKDAQAKASSRKPEHTPTVITSRTPQAAQRAPQAIQAVSTARAEEILEASYAPQTTSAQADAQYYYISEPAASDQAIYPGYNSIQ